MKNGEALVPVLRPRSHYHYLAKQLQPLYQTKDYKQATKLWQTFLVQRGIQGALHATNKQAKHQEMERRRQTNPNDADVKAYFQKIENQKLIQQQYFQMNQESPYCHQSRIKVAVLLRLYKEHNKILKLYW